ncbi:MAG TPA: MBL fold metallo-hydrolase, partial [bacterium]|nr:MBL fold metallo-hydrolase [bacterium]
MAKKSIWKIDPQEKISKTRVLYTGPEKNIHLLKERLKHYKSSDVYPTMSGEYDYQLFFYTTAANDIASITAMAETIFGASVSEYKEKKGIDKKLAIIISGLIALIILFGIYAGYTQYSKVLQQRQAAEQLLKEKEAEELARAAELQKQKEKEEAASAAAAQQAAEEENKEETKEQAPESVEEDKPEETKKEKISKKDEEESVISAQPGFKQPADFSQQIGKILKIIFVDVGQADAIILIMPSRKCYVIDSGDKPKDGKRIIEILQEHKIKEIETLVLTHPHKDHIGGAKYILDNFKVNSV